MGTEALLDIFKTRLELGRQVKASLADDWARNLAAYQGQRNTNSWVTLLTKMAGGADQAPGVPNVPIEQRFVRTIQGKLLAQRPIPTALPVTNSMDDREAAQACTDWLNYIHRSKDMLVKNAAASLLDTMFGTHYWYPWWNPEGGEPVALDPEVMGMDPMAADALLKAWPAKTGCLEIDVLDPNQVFAPPGCTNFNKARWLIIAHMMHVDEVWEQYHVVVEPGYDGEDIEVSHATTSNAPYAGGNVEAENVVVYEYFERTSKASKTGRYAIICQDRVLAEGKDWATGQPGLPERDIPVIACTFCQMPGTYLGMTPISALRALGNMYRRALAKISKTLETSGHKWMVQHGSLDKPIGSEPGEQVNYKTQGSTIQKPSIEQAAGVNAQQFQWLDVIFQQMQFISGAGDVSNGTSPGSDPSGRAVRFMAEQENVAFGQPTLLYRDALCALGRWCLTLTQRHAFRPVVYSVVGHSGMTEAKSMMSHDIRFRDVEYQIESQDAATKQSMRDTFMQLVQQGLITDPAQIMTFLEMPTNDTMYAQDVDQRELAREENETFSGGGEITPPGDWQNHAEHAACHERLMRGARFETMPPDRQMEMLWHNLVHHAFLGHNPFPDGFIPHVQRLISQQPAAPGAGPEGAPEGAPPADGSAPPQGAGGVDNPPVDNSQQDGMLPTTPASQAAGEQGMEHNPGYEQESIEQIQGNPLQ